MILEYIIDQTDKGSSTNKSLEEDEEFQQWCQIFRNDGAYDLNNYFPYELEYDTQPNNF